MFKLHRKHGKKWRISHCKSVWIHVSIHFTWSTNNLGLLLSCCTNEATILERKLVKDWMGKFSPRLGEVLKGTTKDTLQLTDVLTGEAESCQSVAPNWFANFEPQLRRHWTVFWFRETANPRTNEGVCLCLCVFVNSYWPGCTRVRVLVVVNILKCHNFLNIETRETCMSSLKLPAVTMRWFHLEGLWAQHCNSLWFWRSCCRPESPPKWDENGFKMRSSSGVGALETWNL